MQRCQNPVGGDIENGAIEGVSTLCRAIERSVGALKKFACRRSLIIAICERVKRGQEAICG